MQKLMYLFAVSALAMPGMAVADMITETFTFPSPLAGYSAESGSNLTLFNPALGTLTAATLNLNATATWSGGGNADMNQAQYTMTIGGAISVTFSAAVTGNSSDTTSPTTMIPSVGLPLLIGPGTTTTSVSVVNAAGTPASISSSFATEMVTYTYTPVPEPEMFPVLAGILVLGVFWRRRKAAS